jgi:hypothetical protein
MPQRQLFMQTDFSKGELSPKFDGRIEIEQYRQGASVLRNFLTFRQGGISKMPGTLYIRRGISDAHPSRLIPMVMSPTDRYVLEFGHNSISVFKNGARVHDGIATTYTSTDIYNIQMVKVRNVIYLACLGHRVRTLTWTNDTSWVLADLSFVVSSVDFTSAAGKYPRGIAFHEQRLILFGTPDKPSTVWGSKVGTYNDFVLGTTNDAESWEYTIASTENEDLLWATGKDVLFIGSRGGEHILTGHGEGITPTSVFTAKQTPYGSYEVPGQLVDDAVIFVQQGGRLVREYYYQNEQQAYRSPEITFFSDHILDSGVRQVAIQRTPEMVLWFVTNDGRLVGMTYDRNLGIAGWHQHTTDGWYESVAAIPDGEEDRLYAVVRRFINGATVRHIEMFDKRRVTDRRTNVFSHAATVLDLGGNLPVTNITQDDPATLTSAAHGLSNGTKVRVWGVEGMSEVNGVVYTVANAGANTFQLKDETDTIDIDSTGFGEYESGGTITVVRKIITGLGYLEGKDVAVLSDGSPEAGLSVFNGEIELADYHNKIVVGLEYKSAARLMRVGAQELKRIHKLYLRFLDSVGAKVGPTPERLREIVWRGPADSPIEPPPLFSGDKDELFAGVYDRDGYVWVVSDTPTAITVLSITADMAVYQGV